MPDLTNDLSHEFKKIEAQDSLAFDTHYWPYLLRVGRAASYAVASYLLLLIQPHYTFSFSAFSLAVFFLSLGKRVLPVAEVAILLIVIAVFLPVRFVNALLGLV
jgi:uncharacterized membrane protein